MAKFLARRARKLLHLTQSELADRLERPPFLKLFLVDDTFELIQL